MTEIEQTLAEITKRLDAIPADHPHREFHQAMVVNLLSPRLTEAVRQAAGW